MKASTAGLVALAHARRPDVLRDFLQQAVNQAGFSELQFAIALVAEYHARVRRRAAPSA